MLQKTRICFVCLGNIVRSPLAENLFRKLASEAGYGDVFIVESAGTSSFHVGEAPDARMRRVAASHGLIYSGVSKKFTQHDFERFDYIIAMDRENIQDLQRLAKSDEHKQKIFPMRAFDPEGSAKDSVPDPYYGGIEGFEETYRILERSCKGLLEYLTKDGSVSLG